MRIAPVLVACFVGCGTSQVTPPAPPPTAPPSASAPLASSAPVASASVSASASSEPAAPPVEATILEPAKAHRNVALVHVRDHHDFLAKAPTPAKVPSVTLDVLRWLKGPSHHPDSVELRIEKSDPELKDGAVYLLVFDSGFDGKALPSRLNPVLVREMTESDPTLDALTTALGVPEPTKGEICRRAWFNLGALPPACFVTKNLKKEATVGAFTVRLIPATPQVHAGDELPIAVELVNTSQQDAVLSFAPNCVQFEAQAFRNGKRADWLNEWCGFGGGCGGSGGVRLTVAPGGKVEGHVVLSTKVRKVQKSDCSEVDAGLLAAGTYELRVSSFSFFPLADEVGKARAKFDVTK